MLLRTSSNHVQALLLLPFKVMTQDLSIQTFAVESQEPLISENFPEAMLQTAKPNFKRLEFLFTK